VTCAALEQPTDSGVMTAAAFVLGHLAVLVAWAATAGIAGALILHWLRWLPALRSGERWALAPTLGLAVLGHLFGLLGLVGLLGRPAVLATAVAVHWAGRGLWRTLFLALLARRPARRTFTRKLRTWVLAGAGGAIVLSPLFLLALYPPSAFDETLYHLPYARAFAATGGLPFLPELRFPVFPQLAETLSAALLLAAGDVSTHFVALLATLLTGGVLAAWAGGALAAPRAGLPAAFAPAFAASLAAALWLGHPMVAYLGTTGYLEPLLTLFVTATCWSVARWRATGERAALVLAALFGASAADVKYFGLFFLAAVAAAVLCFPGSQPADANPAGRRAHWRAAATFLAVAAAFLLPWYGRIVAFTGNPLFPFLPQLFGENAWSTGISAAPFSGAGSPSWGEGASSYLRRLVGLPWDIVFRRERVGQLPPFSPLAVVAVPLIVVAVLRDRRTRALAALGAAWCLLLPLLPADARYLVPVVPLFALVIAAGLADLLPERFLDRLRRGGAFFVVLVLVSSPAWLYAGYRMTRLGRLPTTPDQREVHLRRQLPVYATVERLHRELAAGERTYLLYAEEMRYHLRGEVVGDWFGPDNYREIGPLLADPRALAHRLRAIGVDYLLIGKTRGNLPPRDQVTAPAWREAFILLHEDPTAALFAVRGEAR
jgi:hypothetical protein